MFISLYRFVSLHFKAVLTKRAILDILKRFIGLILGSSADVRIQTRFPCGSYFIQWRHVKPDANFDSWHTGVT